MCFTGTSKCVMIFVCNLRGIHFLILRKPDLFSVSDITKSIVPECGYLLQCKVSDNLLRCNRVSV